jgi:hypothetical protein
MVIHILYTKFVVSGKFLIYQFGKVGGNFKLNQGLFCTLRNQILFVYSFGPLLNASNNQLQCYSALIKETHFLC